MHPWLTQPRNLFLADGIGALISASLLYGVLRPLEGFFGMPAELLGPLAAIAAAYSLYSLTCYFFAGKKWPALLLLIAVLNLFYCCLTAVAVAYFFDRLSIWGWAYFLIELVVLYSLIRIEFQALPKNAAE